MGNVGGEEFSELSRRDFLKDSALSFLGLVLRKEVGIPSMPDWYEENLVVSAFCSASGWYRTRFAQFDNVFLKQEVGALGWCTESFLAQSKVFTNNKGKFLQIVRTALLESGWDEEFHKLKLDQRHTIFRQIAERDYPGLIPPEIRDFFSWTISLELRQTRFCNYLKYQKPWQDFCTEQSAEKIAQISWEVLKRIDTLLASLKEFNDDGHYHSRYILEDKKRDTTEKIKESVENSGASLWVFSSDQILQNLFSNSKYFFAEDRVAIMDDLSNPVIVLNMMNTMARAAQVLLK